MVSACTENGRAVTEMDESKCWYDGSPCSAVISGYEDCMDCPIARATAGNGWGP